MQLEKPVVVQQIARHVPQVSDPREGDRHPERARQAHQEVRGRERGERDQREGKLSDTRGKRDRRGRGEGHHRRRRGRGSGQTRHTLLHDQDTQDLPRLHQGGGFRGDTGHYQETPGGAQQFFGELR